MIPTQVSVNGKTANLKIFKRATVSTSHHETKNSSVLSVIANDLSYRFEVELEPEAAKTLAERLIADSA